MANQTYFDVSIQELDRPGNTTAYSALDSVSDNATAGSVSPLVIRNIGIADQIVWFEEFKLETSDTGLGNGVQVRVHLFNQDPTLNSGVQGGDNAAWANKRAGWVGSFVGTFILMNDGGMARCVPEAGNFVMTRIAASGNNFWWQLQTLGAFTPSANSTLIKGAAKGFF